MPTTGCSIVTPTIYVVDDDDSFRIGIGRVLKLAGYAVRTYPSGAAFMQSDPGSGPGCVLMDLFMPDATGLEIQAMLAARRDWLPVIFMSGQGTIPDSVRALQAGAVDFLTKPIKKETLLGAINLAIARYHEARSFRDKLRETQLCYKNLTPRQRAVFEGVVLGKLNKQIAADLGVAERTIKAHRAEVMKKMRVDSVAALVRLAVYLQQQQAPMATDR